MLPYSFINCALAYVMVHIECADTLCVVTLCASCRSLWLCSFCLLESGEEADEEIVRDCSGLS